MNKRKRNIFVVVNQNYINLKQREIYLSLRRKCCNVMDQVLSENCRYEI